jgi:hypothetical protein
VVVFRVPAAPIPLSVPAASASGVYTVSWSQPAGYTVDAYVLERQIDSGAWTSVYFGPLRTYAETVTADGVYSYRAYARNSAGTSPPTPASTVTIELQLTETLPQLDAPVVQPTVPAQQFVGTGTIHGVPSVEGGAATYRIDIGVPPGRAGMQPEVSLTYSSRSGNGLAGVGWSVSSSSTIYRCPRTLAQEGGNAPVRLQPNDRLCYDGRRLVAVDPSTYGLAGSEYRTEVDPFDQIKLLGGNIGDQRSYFQVEHKSGRISRFVVMQGSVSAPPPSTWYRVFEYDRAGNCIQYNWNSTWRGQNQEVVPASIENGRMDGGSCLADATRSVWFEYTNDRLDKTTTYRAGAGTLMTSRLSAIVVYAWGPSTEAKRYELAYEASAGSSRSLLSSITVCAGTTCGAEKLASTTFTYRQSAPVSSMTYFSQGSILAGDYDGDGTRDLVLLAGSSRTYGAVWDLKLSTCSTAMRLTPSPWVVPSGAPSARRVHR